MKNPATKHERCGTYAGYKGHRKRNEEICPECRVALNVYRRQYRKDNLHKERQWRDKYLSNPEVHERVKAYAREYSKNKPKTPEQLKAAEARAARAEERKRAKKARSEAFALVKQDRAIRKRQKEIKKLAKALRARLRSIQEQERSLAHQTKLANAAIKRKARIERIAARKQELGQKRQEQADKRKARELLREQLKNQHGTSPGDYYRCRKANGTACDPCKAASAAYVRDKWKTDPKYKQREKEWLKRNPNKKYRKDDRIKRHNVLRQYYTREHIFKRDGYNCHICNTSVDLTASHIVGTGNWELYPHIDHVIPISKGGPDTLANVKIAHAKCNLAKGDKLLY